MPPTFIPSLLPPHPRRQQGRFRSRCCTRPPTEFSVCTGPTCSQSAFGKSLPNTLCALLSDTSSATASPVGCLGECGLGPNVGVSRVGTTPCVRRAISSVSALVQMLSDSGITPPAGLVDALRVKEHADTLFSSGQLAAAAGEYERVAMALASHPRLESAARANWAAVLLEMGRVDEGLRQANTAVDCAADGVGGWKRKMEAHEKRGEKEMAVKCGKVILGMVGERERDGVEKRINRLQRRWFW